MRNKRTALYLFIIFLIVVLSYAGYTARHLILGPKILLDVPNGVMTVSVQVIEISGTTQNTTELRLNNNKILLTQDGKFTERMLLSVGTNTFIFDAKDRFDNTSQETLQIIYDPPNDNVLQLKDVEVQ